MRYRIAVDTGGTFTDVVRRRRRRAAALRQGADDARADVRRLPRGARVAGEELGLTLEELLGSTDLFVYATTAPPTRSSSARRRRRRFFTTEGFPDVLALREGGKMEPFNFAIPYPDPYVPRRLTFEIPGRIDAQGGERRALDEDAVRRATGGGATRGGARRSASACCGRSPARSTSCASASSSARSGRRSR